MNGLDAKKKDCAALEGENIQWLNIVFTISAVFICIDFCLAQDGSMTDVQIQHSGFVIQTTLCHFDQENHDLNTEKGLNLSADIKLLEKMNEMY